MLGLLTTVLGIVGAILVLYLRGIKGGQGRVESKLDQLSQQTRQDKEDLVDRIHRVELQAAEKYVLKTDHLGDYMAIEKLVTDKFEEIKSLMDCRGVN